MDCALGDEHCDFLDQVLRSCAENCPYLDRLAALGADVSDWKGSMEANREMAAGLKAIHFPDRH